MMKIKSDVVIDLDFLHYLRNEQLAHARDYLTDDTIKHLDVSDDINDYVCAALDLASLLTSYKYDDDIDSFRALLDPSNRDAFVYNNYACDGICNAIALLFRDHDNE